MMFFVGVEQQSNWHIYYRKHALCHKKRNCGRVSARLLDEMSVLAFPDLVSYYMGENTMRERK